MLSSEAGNLSTPGEAATEEQTVKETAAEEPVAEKAPVKGAVPEPPVAEEEEDGPLEDWTKKELAAECKTLGLSYKKTKAVLIARIKEAKVVSEPPVDEAPVEEKAASETEAEVVKEPMAEKVVAPAEEKEKQLFANELKMVALNRKVSGLKENLEKADNNNFDKVDKNIANCKASREKAVEYTNVKEDKIIKLKDEKHGLSHQINELKAADKEVTTYGPELVSTLSIVYNNLYPDNFEGKIKEPNKRFDQADCDIRDYGKARKFMVSI